MWPHLDDREDDVPGLRGALVFLAGAFLAGAAAFGAGSFFALLPAAAMALRVISCMPSMLCAANCAAMSEACRKASLPATDAGAFAACCDTSRMALAAMSWN